MNKLINILILAVIILGGMWFFTKDSETQIKVEDKNTIKENNQSLNKENNSIVDIKVSLDTDIQEFSVDGSEFKFSPSVLKVKRGDVVKINFKNTGAMPHDLKIDEFKVATKILPPGSEIDTVTFVADKAGTFEFYCSVGSHRAKGMLGQLIVE